MSEKMNVYINPYSDAFTERLIRAKEKRDKLKEDDASDIVLSRRNSGLQFSTISADTSCLHSSRKTFVSRPLSACRIRNSSSNINLFQDEGEILTRSRSASTNSRYKEGERNVFEHLSNLAKKKNHKVLSTTISSSSAAAAAVVMKPWIPYGKQKNKSNTTKNTDDINCNSKVISKKSRDSKLMNDLYVYMNTKSSINTPISNCRYNDTETMQNTNEIFIKDNVSEISININNADSDIFRRKSSIFHQPSVTSTISPKKIPKERSRVALSGHIIDKTSDVESCRPGILLVSRGSTSEELITAIRHQFGYNNISDVIINFKSKTSQSVISRSYSMDKLEEIPQIDENCDFIAYIGGSALIDVNQYTERNDLNDYDYNGLRDRLSKKLHSFSVGNDTKDDKNDLLSVVTFDANQHSQSDDLEKTSRTKKNNIYYSSKNNLSVSKIQSTCSSADIIPSTSVVNDIPIISSSLKTKARHLSTTSEKNQTKKELVNSLLSSSKPTTKSSVGKLFPYASQDQANKIESIAVSNTTNTVSSCSVSSENNIIQKPKIKFQLDLSSLLEE